MLMRKNVSRKTQISFVLSDGIIKFEGFSSLPAIIRDRVLYTTGG